MDAYWRGKRNSVWRSQTGSDGAKTHFSRIPQHLQWFSSLSQGEYPSHSICQLHGVWLEAEEQVVEVLPLRWQCPHCADSPTCLLVGTFLKALSLWLGALCFKAPPSAPTECQPAPHPQIPPHDQVLNPAGRQIWKTSAGWRSKGEAKACCSTPLPAGFKLSC